MFLLDAITNEMSLASRAALAPGENSERLSPCFSTRSDAPRGSRSTTPVLDFFSRS